MANVVTVSSLATPSGGVVLRATQTGLVTATGQFNTFPGGGACTLYEISVDNTANPSTACYFKFYDATGPATTADPDIVIPVPGGSVQVMQILEGWAVATNASWGVSTAGGSTAGAAMTNPVVVAVTLGA